MADPFSIIGVIGVAGQIIQIGIQFGLDWKDAPTEVKSFMTELQALKTTLSETNTNTALNQDFLDAFHGRHSALLSQVTDLAPSTDTSLMVGACQTELENLLAELKKRAKGHRVGWERMKGAFLAKKTRETVENLHRQCQILNSLVAIDSAALGATILKEAREDRKKQLDREAATQQGTVLNWLAPVDFASQQNDFIRERGAGTGQWFLDSPEFQAWLQADKQTLFCPGIPGAGKTILSSIVVDELMTRFGNDKTIGIAYVYCSFQRQDKQKAEDVLASLLKQLAEGQSALPESVKSLHDKHKGKRTRLSLDEVSTALCSVVALYSRTFVIIDALDEALFEDRDKFLAALSNLQQGGQAHLNILTTSRPEVASHFEEHFDGYIPRQIRAADNDVLSHIQGRLSTNRRPRLSKFPDLQDAIKRQVVKAADGMFLLAKLHMDYLLSKPTAGDVEDALTDLPHGISGLDKRYHQAMERINNHKEGQRDITYKVLYWIVHAKRPLSTAELQHAVAVRPGATEIKEKFLIEVEDLISDCAGLVTVDKESGIIRLVHYTTQDYFKRTQKDWFPNAETDITITCVTYLSFDAFEAGFFGTEDDSKARLRQHQHPLYDYAVRNWGHHALAASTNAATLILEFLESEAKVSTSSQALMVLPRDSGDSNYSQRVAPQWTGVHLAAYFGLREAIMALLKNGYDPNAKDAYGRTPLSWAAENGYGLVVQLLLEEGGRVDLKDTNGWTPLSWAVESGNVEVMRLLLDAGADMNYRYDLPWEIWDDRARSPLSRAAEKGDKMAAKLLIEKGAQPDLDCIGWKPLSWAMEKGNVELMQLLLDADAAMDYTYMIAWREWEQWDERSPLSRAAEKGNEAAVKLLLKKGAQPDIKERSSAHPGWTPLSYAAQNGQNVVVKLLIDAGAAVETKHVLLAIGSGHEAIVKLLLENGGLESKDNHGRTPLSYVAQNGSEADVHLLLEQDATAESADNSGRTPLSYAAGNDKAVVQLLLEQGAAIESADNSGRTPLSYAAGNDKAVMQLLLEQGAAIESADNSGRTPLSYAAQCYDEAIVQLLLEQGATAESADNSGRTPLSYAANSGGAGLVYTAENSKNAIVQLLLKQGAAIESADNSGRTPLSYAAGNDDKAVVQLLLEQGAAIESADNSGRIQLLFAENGDKAVIQLLLKQGAAIESADNSGRTPLSYAAENSKDYIVQLLLEQGATAESASL
ncbi:hypothetical protein FMUND_15405 [Fusarium mundagurra]|uniref:NACHT domain-containing protein n=1 Tax=Fusarium mundagurra TaxID=1567541 RepID=A0A8H6CZ70_9HYPO|nr:hypothetical protein FMUND_15405 [Fusarium mundagurra]